jgi:hypothetical protein
LLLVDEVFAEIVRVRRAKYVGVNRVSTAIDRAQLERECSCPGCGRSMETHAYYGPGNQVIDSCATCGLVWVDSNELAAIEQAAGRR